MSLLLIKSNYIIKLFLFQFYNNNIFFLLIFNSVKNIDTGTFLFRARHREYISLLTSSKEAILLIQM